MKKKIRLTENEFRNLIKKIVMEQDGDDQYYKISPEEYQQLMKLSGYHGNGVSRLPKFGGKPLYITGDVDLSNTSTDSLGNVAYIDGRLQINYTKIKDLGDTKVKGYVSDSGTPREQIRRRMILQAKHDEMSSKKEDGEWDLSQGINNLDDEGIKANALYQYLVNDGTLDEEEYDVYDLYPLKSSHYGLLAFELLSQDGEYTVGTSDEMDEAALEYAKNYIDEVGSDGFNESFLVSHIDTDDLKSYFEDWWRDDIYSNPDIYFNEDDFELTEEQEARIEAIEEEVAEYERQQSELDDSREDYDELYDDFQEKIDELESEKDEITPDTNSPTDDMVERVLEDRLEDVENNPMQYIREYDLDLSYYIDEDDLAQALVDSDGWGIMNGYDGDYDSINIEGDDYYIMRIS